MASPAVPRSGYPLVCVHQDGTSRRKSISRSPSQALGPRCDEPLAAAPATLTNPRLAASDASLWALTQCSCRRHLAIRASRPEWVGRLRGTTTVTRPFAPATRVGRTATGEPMTFMIPSTNGHRHTLIAVTGAVDAAATAALRETLDKAVLAAAPVLVDLVCATSIDYAAVATVIAAQRQATLGGTSLLLRIRPAQLPMLLEALGTPPDRKPSKPESVPRQALRLLLNGTVT